MNVNGVKGLEFTIIPTGTGENDPGYNWAGYKFGDMLEKDRPREWMSFPLYCVLIKHPDVGYIMYDAGPGPGDEVAENGRRPYEAFISNPAFIKREEFVDKRLEQLGLSVNDINAIIISHFHWDHIGGMEFFKGTKAIKNMYAPEKDFAHGLVATHKTAKGYSDRVYFKSNFEIEGCEYTLLKEDETFAPGIEMIMLEGHTPAVLGLMLHLESKTYILPSDAVNAALNYGPPIVYPGIIYDTLGVVRTIEKLRKLEKQYDAELIFPHDPWQFETVKKMEAYK